MVEAVEAALYLYAKRTVEVWVVCVKTLKRSSSYNTSFKTYVVLSFLGVRVLPSSSSGGHLFFLGDTCKEE